MSDTIYDKLNSLKKEVEKRIDQLRKLEKDGKKLHRIYRTDDDVAKNAIEVEIKSVRENIFKIKNEMLKIGAEIRICQLLLIKAKRQEIASGAGYDIMPKSDFGILGKFRQYGTMMGFLAAHEAKIKTKLANQIEYLPNEERNTIIKGRITERNNREGTTSETLDRIDAGKQLTKTEIEEVVKLYGERNDFLKTTKKPEQRNVGRVLYAAEKTAEKTDRTNSGTGEKNAKGGNTEGIER